MKKILLLILCLSIAACLGRPIVQPSPEKIHLTQNQTFETEILKVAQNGDWLVTRGYHVSDTFVANATNIPLSHAGILDLDRMQIIEAEASGVHTTPLADFINKSHRILVIRPRWATDDNRDRALAFARAAVGKKYDFLGTIGINTPNRYYCSELAVAMYKPWHRRNEHLPRVIEPGSLYLWGCILYDSDDRN